MFKHLTRVRDFILPVLLILMGGYVGTWEHARWFQAALLIWLVSLSMTGWLIACGIINEQREYQEVLNDRIVENIRWYEMVHKLTDEEKVELGLGTVPNRVTLEVNKSTDAGFYVRDLKFLSVSPVKFKALAYACLNGTPFAIRALSGPGKILTDAEFRQLKDELIQFGLLAPRSEKDERQGYYWTDDGQAVLQEMIESSL